MYQWKAITSDGNIAQGVFEAQEKAHVRTWIRNQGNYPLRIRPKKRSITKIVFHINTKERWITVIRRLATLLDSGIPILPALTILIDGLEKDRQQWEGLKENIAEGGDLSSALMLIRPAPSAFLISMVKIGEQTGSLSKQLSEAADELEQEFLLWRKVKLVSTYPLLLVLSTLIVLYIMGIWVLPMYEVMFTNLNAQLPYLTEVIFALGRQIPVFLTGFLAIVFILVIVIRFKDSEKWQIKLNYLFNFFPLLGGIYRLSDLIQFSRTSGKLLGAGFTLLDALQIAFDSVRSREMKWLIKKLIHDVKQGNRISAALRTQKVIPVFASEMLIVAEESGRLDYMLNYISQIFRKELERELERITRLLEPLLVLGAAALIGLVAIGVLLPIFDAGTHLQ